MSRPIDMARRRAIAWLRAIEAVADQRDALEYRIHRGEPDDTHLGADVQTWGELARALSDFLKSRRAK